MPTAVKAYIITYSFETGLEMGTTKIIRSIVCLAQEKDKIIHKEIKDINSRGYPFIITIQDFRVSACDIVGDMVELLYNNKPEYFI